MLDEAFSLSVNRQIRWTSLRKPLLNVLGIFCVFEFIRKFLITDCPAFFYFTHWRIYIITFQWEIALINVFSFGFAFEVQFCWTLRSVDEESSKYDETEFVREIGHFFSLGSGSQTGCRDTFVCRELRQNVSPNNPVISFCRKRHIFVTLKTQSSDFIL
jgi:hypothetical protein